MTYTTSKNPVAAAAYPHVLQLLSAEACASASDSDVPPEQVAASPAGDFIRPSGLRFEEVSYKNVYI